MQSRQVLATNHVVEIMLRWLETGSWADAFMAVMPKRKGGTLKDKAGEDENVEDGDEGLYEKKDGEAAGENQKLLREPAAEAAGDEQDGGNPFVAAEASSSEEPAG